MFKQVLLLCFLVAGLGQLTSSAVASNKLSLFDRITSLQAAFKAAQTGEEESESYIELKVLKLNKDVTAKGDSEVSQLVCKEKSDDEEAEKVCPTYAADEAECFNRNYKLSFVPSFVCDLTNARFTNPAITLDDDYTVKCEHTDGTNDQYYVIGSCSLEYRLNKDINYKSENDIDRDAVDSPKDGLGPVAIVFIVLGVLAVVTLISLCVVRRAYPNSALGEKLTCLG